MNVTAIVPTYNRVRYLRESLRSLLAQTRPVAEIIVVDDGSTDATRSVVEGFGGRIRYVHQENGGKSAALNHGLRLATGDAIWILDDDDIAAPDAVERLAVALDGEPDAGFAFGNFDLFADDAVGVRHFWPAHPYSPDPADLYWQQLTRCTIFQGAMLVRRAALDEVGPFDIALPRAQDYDMLLRLTRQVRSIHVDAVLFHQRHHAGERGPLHMRIASADLSSRQAVFDAAVLRLAHERSTLDDFLPRTVAGAAPSAATTCRALLRRAAAMGQRGLWDIAARDLSAALEIADTAALPALPREALPVLARCFRENGQDVDCRRDNPMLLAAAASADPRIRRELLTALSWQLLLGGLKSAIRRDPRGTMRRIGRYASLTKGTLLPTHMRYLIDWSRETIARRRRRAAIS